MSLKLLGHTCCEVLAESVLGAQVHMPYVCSTPAGSFGFPHRDAGVHHEHCLQSSVCVFGCHQWRWSQSHALCAVANQQPTHVMMESLNQPEPCQNHCHATWVQLLLGEHSGHCTQSVVSKY